MSNTAASSFNAGLISSQHSQSNSYSQSNSNKQSVKHSRHGSAKAASTINNSHLAGGSSHQLGQMLQSSHGHHHSKNNSVILASHHHHPSNTLSHSYLHQSQMPQMSASVMSSGHKRNIQPLTQSNHGQYKNSNSVVQPGSSLGTSLSNHHYQNGSQTIVVPNGIALSHNYNNGIGLSVKQSQLRHSQHYQQQVLQS